MKKATLLMISNGQKWCDLPVTKLLGLFRNAISKHLGTLLFELLSLF